MPSLVQSDEACLAESSLPSAPAKTATSSGAQAVASSAALPTARAVASPLPPERSPTAEYSPHLKGISPIRAIWKRTALIAAIFGVFALAIVRLLGPQWGSSHRQSLSFPVSAWSRVPPVDALVPTLIGLLGFIAACIFFALSIRTRHERRNLELLPERQRSRILADLLSRYGLSFENAHDEAMKVVLVRREIDLRSRKHLTLAVLSAAAFVLCVAMVAIDRVRPRTPDERVIDYKREIGSLVGDSEAMNPGRWSLVRREGISLASRIGEIGEDQLSPPRRIIQHEYKGWALLQDIKNMSETGGEDARPIYEWIAGVSEDIARTHYLRAIALAVIARAGVIARRPT
jgi:hypothetical protein